MLNICNLFKKEEKGQFKSFLDLKSSQKRRILKEAVRESNESQRKLFESAKPSYCP